MMRLPSRSMIRGVALVELVVAIVIFSISVAGIAALLSSNASRSAEMMSRAQAASIASAYLEQILAEAFDDVDDHHGTDHPGARDQFGNVVAGLDQYRVQVAVNNVQLGDAPDNVPALRVDVTVTSPAGDVTVLSGYRSDYAGQILY
jgi:MSHA pilin protein MshD